MTEPSPPERLDPATAEAVLRRATELDQHFSPERSGVDRYALEAAAGEVGISPASVRQALAEHDAGALGPPDTSRSILGPARARAMRTVDLPVHLARARVERWLKSQLLEVWRRTGDEIEWRRRDDLGAKLRRKIDPTKRVRLGTVDAVIDSVVDDGNGRAVVRLEADLVNTRTGLRTGVVMVPAAAGPVLGGAAALVLGEPFLVAAGVPVGLAMGGTGIVVARKTLATELADAQAALDLFLDELDRGR